MILPPQEIEFLSAKEGGLIHPFSHKVKFNGVSYGLAECGYDVRLDQDITLYPVNLKYLFLQFIGYERPSFTLASTIEKFNVPNDLMFLIKDKSTWARKGLSVQNTIAEPGWNGYLTLEINNHGREVISIKKGTAIAQAVFYKLASATHFPYKGKYQVQKKGPQEAVYYNY